MNSNPPQSNEVPTARTNAAIAGWNSLPMLATSQEIVTAAFARILERELAEARNAFDKSYADVARLQQQLSTLTKPIEPEVLGKAVETVQQLLDRWAYHLIKEEGEAIQTLIRAVRQMREALTDIASSNCSETVFNKATEALNQLKTRGDGK